MNVRTTIILFAILVGGLATFGLLQWMGVRTPEERKEAAKWLLPSLKDKFKPVEAKEFTRVVVERNLNEPAKKERLEFVKDGEDWKMISPKKARLDSSAVAGFSGLINQVQNAEIEKTAMVSPNLAENGLDQPKARVTLYRGDAESVVNIGDQGPQKDPHVYITSSERPEPMAVKKSQISKVFAPIEEFRSKELFTSTLDVTGLNLKTGETKMELERIDNKDWKFKSPGLGDADNEALEEMVRNLATIRVEKNADFVADGPKLDLAPYGLTDDKAKLEVTITRKGTAKEKGPVSETLIIGAKDPQGGTQATARRGGLLALRLVPPVALPTDATILGALAAVKAREQQDQDDAPYFAKLKTEDSVVRIDGKHLKNLDKKADELRSRRLARIDASKVDAINITSGGETLRLRRPELKATPSAAPGTSPADWLLWTDKQAKVKTHLNMVPNVIDAVNKVEVKDGKAFLDSPAKEREWFGMDTIDLGFDKPQAEVALWLEGIQRDKENKPEGGADAEPKLKDAVKDKPNVKLTIGRKDDKRGVVYVKRKIGDGPDLVLAVPDPWMSAEETKPEPPSPFGPKPTPPRESYSLSKLTTGGYLAFRDHVLPSFKTMDASKLQYDRAGVSYVAEKEEKKDDKGFATSNWNLKQPVEAKGGFAVSGLLSMLAQLNAENLVADKATPEQLKEFGLDAPLIKATVTAGEKDKKPSEFAYFIGKTTDPKGPNPNRFYARIEAKPGEGTAPEANQFVFLLPWSTVQGLDVELRDTTVFESERSGKPEEITLTWRKLDKEKKPQETQLVLAASTAKEGDDKKTWTVKSLTANGKDAKADLPKLDTAKVDQLLGVGLRFGGPVLNPLMAERFVVHNGEPKPEHRLDPAKPDAPPSLVIEIKFDNQSSRKLTIGDRWEPKEAEHPGLSNKSFYFAAASTLPKAVFLLDEANFKELVAGFEYFKAGEKVALECGSNAPALSLAPTAFSPLTWTK